MGNLIPPLENRKSPFEIKTELQVRKRLESLTPWFLAFNKNESKYEYDLKCDYYKQDGDDWYSVASGFVEVEVSESWKSGSFNSGYPANWSSHSFLKRKVFDFDFQSGRWLGVKTNASKTVYLIANSSIDNCVAVMMNHLIENAKDVCIGATYLDTFLRLPLDSEFVVSGFDAVSKFIEKVMLMAKAGWLDA